MKSMSTQSFEEKLKKELFVMRHNFYAEFGQPALLPKIGTRSAGYMSDLLNSLTRCSRDNLTNSNSDRNDSGERGTRSDTE